MGGISVSLGLKPNIVELVDHDFEWKKLANETIQRLWEIFGSLAKDIQHIGSTSIQNIRAKPIIDIAVAIEDFETFYSLIPTLESNGFMYRGWFIEERSMVLNVYKKLELEDNRVNTHYIHIEKMGSNEWHDHINFRNYLNAHPAVAKTYEAIKIKLAAENAYDEGRKKYGAGKNDFIKKTLQDAVVWLQ